MAKNFTDNIKNNISTDGTNIKNEATKEISINNSKLVLGKKSENKTNKKAIPLYLLADKVKELDKICKKTGYSRNELLNILIDFGLDKLELI